jgi:hypothetical protein
MTALAQALADYEKGEPTLPRAAAPAPNRRNPTRHAMRTGVVVGALALLAGGAVAAVIYSRSTDPEDKPALLPPSPLQTQSALDRLFESMTKPLLKVEVSVSADEAAKVSRQSIPPKLLERHDGPLYFSVSGNGAGHLLDLTDMLGQAGQIQAFGPGDITVSGAYLLFLSTLTEETRIFVKGGPARSMIAPMSSVGAGSKHIEFDGTHLLMPKIGPPLLAAEVATPAEIARLRTPELTRKLTLRYPQTEYVLFTWPTIQVIPSDGEERKRQFPEIHNLIELDRSRQNVARTITLADLRQAEGK